MRTGVDRRRAAEGVGRVAHVVEHLSGGGTVAVVAESLQRVSVGVGGAGQLPLSEHRCVSLTRGQVGADHVALSLDDHDRDVEIVTDGRRRRERDDGKGRLGERRAGAEAAVHEEAVVDLVDRLDRVDVGDETARRLRFTGRDQSLRLESTEHLRTGVVPDPRAGLTEDVVRVAVSRVDERAVPSVVVRDQASTPTF